MKKNTKIQTTNDKVEFEKLNLTILIQRLGKTSGKLQILFKKENMKILRANFICHDWKEFNVMIIARINGKKE